MGSKRKRAAQDVSATEPNPKKQQKRLKTLEELEKHSLKSTPTPIPHSSSPFLVKPDREERKREFELYEYAGSENIVDRLNAAGVIVSCLFGGDGVEEPTLQRHLEKQFRGLASGRKCARLGFSVVLTEVLAQLFGSKDLASEKYTSLAFDKVVAILVAKTKPDGDLSGQEEKDHFLGLLFGLQSFVRAKILFSENERWSTILEKLLDLAKKKPWIREECGWVVVEALGQMDQGQTEDTLEQVQNAGLAQSPEGVGIWLTARNRFPDMKFPSKSWGQSGNPLEHLKSLAKALKESSSSEDGGKTQQAKQTGNWNAQLHWVWNIVLTNYATAVKMKRHGVKSEFENFWKVVVDENLFSATASRERKFWGFLLFQKVIQDPVSFVKLLPSIFSHNLVRCLINHVQERDRFLHGAANKSLNILIQTVAVNPQLLSTILPRLIGGYGTYNFDKVTKTKTVERLLGMVDGENATAVIKALVEPALVVQGTESDLVKEAELRRQLLGDYLLNTVRKVNITDESSESTYINDVALPTIARFAYSIDSDCQPRLSEKTRTLFRNRLMSAFGHLLSDIKGYSYPCNLVLSLSPDVVDMDDEIVAAKDGALLTMGKILKKIRKSEKKSGLQSKAPLQALALLYSLSVFQLYNGEAEAASILDELKLCYDKLIKHKDSEDTEASEVLAELLLSFISKPSALFRKVTSHVFGAFMSDMTTGGVKLMTDVLESDESLRGQQWLFDQESDNENGEEDDELDSDVEVVDMNAEEGNFNVHTEEEQSEDEEGSNVDDEEGQSDEDEDAKKLDEALAQALGTHRLDDDAEAESDSDADMTDSEMMALDSKLVEIFSQRKKVPNKKQEQKDAKETVVNFKSRILDLLDIYVKKQASNPLAFGLLLPLLQLMRSTKTKSLSEKAHNIIITFAKASKGVKREDLMEVDVDVDEMLKLMKDIQLEATKDPSHVFAKAASTASLLVASRLFRIDRSNGKKIVEVYADSQGAVLEDGLKIHAAFFHDFANWVQSHNANV